MFILFSHRCSFPQCFSTFMMQLDDVFEHSRVPHARVQRIHGIVAVAFLQTTKGSGVVDFLHELTQNGGLLKLANLAKLNFNEKLFSSPE